MSVIEVDTISKTFHSAFKRDSVKALDNVSIDVDEGSIFGLLGKNGAGKTTLVKILLGLTFPSSGVFKIFDNKGISSKTKMRIGYLPENHNLPDFLKGRDMMHYFGRLVGLSGAELGKRIDKLLELVNMTKWQNKKIKTYSKGMMQRLGLAQAMLNSPDLLFLDEPTDGVDPIGRKEIRDILIELRSSGTTIFLNSHLLSEVEMITDRIAILNNGRLISEGRVEDYTTAKEEYKISAEDDLTDVLSAETVSTYFIKRDEKGSFNIKTKNTEDLNKLIDEIRAKGILIKEVSLLKTSLEDIFIDIVKESDNGALN